ITYTEDRNGSKQEYKADGEKDDIKMSVLVNENSASSSEILAGALKDNGYKIVGEKTFGKGIIQQTMELDDGSAVKLTVAQYFTPDGHKVHKKGISPNVEVKNSSSGDRQLDKALSILN
ncbi:MAG: S41 family peptidase, partial [Firmicutes bacterium]|nr:S41 family peptidase [Bacillota bacterium]